MKKIALAIVVLMLAACQGPDADVRPPVEKSAEPLTCLQQCLPLIGCICLGYTPDPPPNFYSCAGDTNVYDGELVVFTQANFGGFCFYTHPTSSLTWSTLGDLDINSPATYHILSYKSRLHTSGIFYDGTSQNTLGAYRQLGASSNGFITFSDPNMATWGWAPSSAYASNLTGREL